MRHAPSETFLHHCYLLIRGGSPHERRARVSRGYEVVDSTTSKNVFSAGELYRVEEGMLPTGYVCVGLRLLVFALLLPGVASAQQGTASGIAGVVRDTSGAVLPGVTVEAASPALIEKVR